MRLAFLVVVVAGIALTALGGYDPRGAGAQCNPGRLDDDIHYLSGWGRRPGGTVGGVYSRILNYDPYVHPGGGALHEVVLGWSMLVNTNLTRWGQVGWMERAGNFRYTFTQWWDSSGVIHTTLLADQPQPINTYSYYTVLYGNYAPGWITFQVNGVDRQYIPPAGWTPVEGQTSGEILTLASQMPGGVNFAEYFTDTHIWYNNGWKSFNGMAGVNPSGASVYFGNVKQSSLQLKIWDKACAN